MTRHNNSPSDPWPTPHLAAMFSDAEIVPPEYTATGEAWLAAEVKRLRTECDRLVGELEHAGEANRHLRSRLAKALSERSATTHDAATLDQAEHTVLADQFRDLIAQDVQHLLRKHQRTTIGRPTPQLLAQHIHALCRDLFIDGHRDPATACRRLGMDPADQGEGMHELIGKVKVLCQRAGDVEWDLDVAPGRVLDPKRQQPWGQCDPTTVIEFAVAPAYRVGRRVYVKQQVFTKARRFPWPT
ncbi:hypothetical protein [Alloactinosynnema sp. L-07]|uniref:hypothetical protein n=1 Tax=Alloactinosynnema sp. L-07 TaxID=1653480 RepID=UPI00065F0357|nr:hypothetical protein [Alloactinosynnema sp. L-07]CRK56806.1 hypothetical protein [Alloactinosynnema sp. L-07]